jgi:hypothetical protein
MNDELHDLLASPVQARGWLDASLRAAGTLRLAVNGTSMLPLLRPDDAVWIEPLDPDQARCGDIVTVWRRGTLITHRLISRRDEHWITKGDNCRLPDPTADTATIVGRVTCVERDGVRIHMRAWRWVVLQRGIAMLSRLEGWGYRIHQRATDHPWLSLCTSCLPIQLATLPWRLPLRGLVQLALASHQLAAAPASHSHHPSTES